jgi:flagellar biosynthesis protein FlhF
MRLKTFNASDIHIAMQMIRESMGEDAVIISTSPDPLGNGVNVTVATDTDDADYIPPPIATIEPSQAKPTPKITASHRKPQPTEPREFTPIYTRTTGISQQSTEQVIREIEKILRFHAAPDYLVSKLLETARYINFEADASPEGINSALRKILDAAFQYTPLPIEKDNFRIMLVGPPGIGKTMTVAKIAAQVVMDKKKIVVITTDNKRAGGVEQLSAFTSILGLDLRVAGSRSELRKTLQESAPNSRILIDTAGTNPYDLAELKELSEFMGFDDIEPVLATAAGMDTSEAEDITRAFGFLGIRKLLVTRADTARRYGSILSAANAGALAFCNVSSTSKVIGEFRKMDAAYLAQLLLQHKQ